MAQGGEEAKKVIGVVLRSRAKTIHFIRHAEGTHNKAAAEEGRSAYKKEEHADARITDIGKKQCADLKAAEHAVLLEAKLVIVSPLTRAIQTALLSIDQVPGVPWIALECLRERAGEHPCDRRRAVHEIKKEYPMISFDSIADDEDKIWQADEREPETVLAERAREMLAWLGERSETNIAVVTHSAFLSCLFNNVVPAPAHVAKWFENCELRTVYMDL